MRSDETALLEAELRREVGRPIALTLTDNVRSMISFRQERDRVNLRLHHMFLDAPQEVMSALAEWIDNPAARPGVVRQYMRENRDRVRPRKERDPSRIILRPHGRFHNLDSLFAGLNARYFDSQLEMRITWGRKTLKRRPRTMRLGAYYEETRHITISRRLDRRNVPRYFVEYVVYHEMLHAALGIKTDANGRRHAHT
ncbi:MAG: SprT-like domain-containing protein, partial [Planctomycetota bacterium]